MRHLRWTGAAGVIVAALMLAVPLVAGTQAIPAAISS